MGNSCKKCLLKYRKDKKHEHSIEEGIKMYQK